MKHRIIKIIPFLPLVGYPMLFVMSITNSNYTGWKQDKVVTGSVVLHLVSWMIFFIIFYAIKFGLLCAN